MLKRTNKQYILMSILFGGAAAVLPFAVYRFSQHDWLIAIIDIIVVIGMFGLGSYVYVKRETRYVDLFAGPFVLSALCAVIYLKGPALIYWAYPTMVGLYFALSPRRAIIFCGLAAVAILPVLVSQLELVTSMSIFITLIINNLFAYVFATGMHRQGERLMLMSKQDALTGAGNRRALNEKLNEIIQAVKRTPQPFALIILDVDHFKRVNDNYGHVVGDQVLINLVSLIKVQIRITDRIYRFGGEEFVVLAMGADLAAAEVIAEKLRQKVAEQRFVDDRMITVSQGVALHTEGESADVWLNRADKALYKAKDSGRNIVCYAEALESI